MNGNELSVAGNRALLQQGVAMLERLSDALYAEPRGTWAPVGAQYRHILEHYRSFFAGWPEGRVDYDARARDERIERNRSAALLATRECLAALDRLDGTTDRPLEVQMDGGGGSERPDWRPSSAGRELQFLCSHTVHHYALIKLLLQPSGPDLGTEFGVAPSTLAYQRAAR
jgi:DinB family protein